MAHRHARGGWDDGGATLAALAMGLSGGGERFIHRSFFGVRIATKNSLESHKKTKIDIKHVLGARAAMVGLGDVFGDDHLVLAELIEQLD